MYKLESDMLSSETYIIQYHLRVVFRILDLCSSVYCQLLNSSLAACVLPTVGNSFSPNSIVLLVKSLQVNLWHE